jgi:hypothetical protein
MADERTCREALSILVDCVQLCKIVKGEADSCTFNSVCSETFTGVVMQHLCNPGPPETSLPSRFLLPVIESELRARQPNPPAIINNDPELTAKILQLEEVG